LAILAFVVTLPVQSAPTFVPQRSLGAVKCASLHSSKPLAATGSANGVCVWDLESGVIVAQLGRSNVRSVSFFHGTNVAVSSEQGVETWDWMAGKTQSLGGWYGIANRAGTRLAVFGHVDETKTTVKILDADLKVLEEAPFFVAAPDQAALCDDARYVVFSDALGGGASVFDVPAGKVVATYRSELGTLKGIEALSRDSLHVAFRPATHQIAVSTFEANVRIFDLDRDASVPINTIGTPDNKRHGPIGFDSAGRTLFWCRSSGFSGSDEGWSAWRVDDGALLWTHRRLSSSPEDWDSSFVGSLESKRVLVTLPDLSKSVEADYPKSLIAFGLDDGSRRGEYAAAAQVSARIVLDEAAGIIHVAGSQFKTSFSFAWSMRTGVTDVATEFVADSLVFDPARARWLAFEPKKQTLFPASDPPPSALPPTSEPPLELGFGKAAPRLVDGVISQDGRVIAFNVARPSFMDPSSLFGDRIDEKTVVASFEPSSLSWKQISEGPRVKPLVLSSKGDRLLSSQLPSQATTAMALVCYDAKSRSPLWSEPGADAFTAPFAFTHSGKGVVCVPIWSHVAVVLDAASGRQRAVLQPAAPRSLLLIEREALLGGPAVRAKAQVELATYDWGPIAAIGATPDDRIALGFSDGAIRLFDEAGKQLAASTAPGLPVEQIVSAATWQRIITVHADGIRMWDSRTLKLIATLVFDRFGSSAIVLPTGHFMSVGDGIELVGFRAGDAGFRPDQVGPSSNRPDLVIRSIGQANAKVLDLYSAACAKLTATTQTPELGTVGLDVAVDKADPHRARVVVVPPVGRPRPVRVRVNGCLVATMDGRGESKISLGSGSNRIEATLVGESGSEGPPSQLTVYAPPRLDRPKLYALVAGISAYRDPRKSLAVADDDARAFAEALRALGQSYDVQATVLIDQQATASALRAAAGSLSGAGPDDLTVVFLAGHGLLDGDGNFAFAPYECDFDAPLKTTLPFADVASWLTAGKSLRRLLLLDACHSGAPLLGDPSVTGKPGARTSTTPPPINAASVVYDVFSQLGQRSGIHAISASTSAGVAYEGLTHGYFTQAILEAMRGNEGLTVNQLARFVQRRVPVLTSRTQRPTLRLRNALTDFTLIPSSTR